MTDIFEVILIGIGVAITMFIFLYIMLNALVYKFAAHTKEVYNKKYRQRKATLREIEEERNEVLDAYKKQPATTKEVEEAREKIMQKYKAAIKKLGRR